MTPYSILMNWYSLQSTFTKEKFYNGSDVIKKSLMRSFPAQKVAGKGSCPSVGAASKPRMSFSSLFVERLNVETPILLLPWKGGREQVGFAKPGNPNWRGRICTVELLVITSWDQLLLVQKLCYFYKTTFPKEEVYWSEPSTSVKIPWLNGWKSIRGIQGRAWVKQLLVENYFADRQFA
jgi:hypothetical protein